MGSLSFSQATGQIIFLYNNNATGGQAFSFPSLYGWNGVVPKNDAARSAQLFAVPASKP
jgi:hypothetical protein